MADNWQTVGTSDVDSMINNWNDVKPGTDFIGYYTNRQDGVGPNNSSIYTLTGKDGKTVGFWGTTALDDKMSKVGVNVYVKLTYNGKKKGEKGRKAEYHDFSLAQDPSQVLDGSSNFNNNNVNVAPAQSVPTNPVVTQQASPSAGAPIGGDDLPF